MLRKFLFALSALVLCLCLVPAVGTQQKEAVRLGHNDSLRHRPLGIMPKVAGTMLMKSSTAQVTSGQSIKLYDVGYYPGGSWSEPRGINDFGIIVGFGDIASGYTRPIGVPLFGPKAFRWFDLGTLGGDRTDTEVMCMGVADTGMIVGHSAISGGEIVHAFAWTPKSGMLDIGTLGDDRSFSLAYNVNKSGSLIVGWSSSQFMGPDSLPVVWTPQVKSGPHGPAIAWKIQQLDTTGFAGATYWTAKAVNDFGQIIGTATMADGSQIAVLWNPLPGGKGWKILQLPFPSTDPNAEPSDINDEGQIVGYFAASDWSVWFPALWKPAVLLRSVYTVTGLMTLTGADQGWGEANGINDVGDIVGDCYDANGNWFGTRNKTLDPSFIKVLGFPGTWSWAYRVNNDHIAVGSYGSDTIPENTAAIKFK